MWHSWQNPWDLATFCKTDISFGTYGFNNKPVFSQYVGLRWQRGTPAFVRANHLCYLYAAQQSVDISCRSDHSSKLCWCDPCWTDRRTDRRTDTVPFHRPCSAYYTVIHNYGNPYEKWNIFVARPHLWLQLGMVKRKIMLYETVLNLSTLNTLTYLRTY